MEITEIREILTKAAELRVPRFTQETGAANKAGELEDFMLAAAGARGDLEQARLELENAQAALERRWDDLEGWEMFAGSKPSKDAVRRAKRRVDPTLGDALDEGRRILDQIARQVRRLEKDEATASRAYSLITGS